MDPSLAPTDNAIVTSIKSEAKIETSRTSSSVSSDETLVNVRQYTISDGALELPPNAGGEGDDAFASEPSVFDDASLAKLYWPRKDYEGIHRFFSDFKWTIREEKRYGILIFIHD